MIRRNNEPEPNYFMSEFSDNSPVYINSLLLPRYCKAYAYEDERRQKYDEFAEKCITGIFGTEDKPKKTYMKQLGFYTIITDPNRFVRDYNSMVMELQKWCRINHITYRAIGAPGSGINKVVDLYKAKEESFKQAEEVCEQWNELRQFSQNVVVDNNALKYSRAECNCYKDMDDDRYDWWITLSSVGRIGNYRLAVETDFDRIEDAHKVPTKLPNVRVRLYLTMYGDSVFSPWSSMEKSYALRADQVSEDYRVKVKHVILEAIDRYDRANGKHPVFDKDMLTWGNNFFRLIKEDFNAYKDINVIFEDGKVWGKPYEPKPDEKLEALKKELEELRGYIA